jgi:hypothetical protein
MWRKQDRLNSTKIEILENIFQVDLKDAKHRIIKTESYKPFKNSDFKRRRTLYYDSMVYSLSNNSSYYCFTENEVKNASFSQIKNLKEVKFKGRFYYVASS